MIKKILEKPLRKAIKSWRHETETSIAELNFRVRQKQLFL